MLESALRFPIRDDDALRALLIGSVLTFLSFLVVPVVFVYGYFLRAIQAAAAGETDVPSWEDWTTLFVDGLRAIAVTIAYLIVPSVLLTMAAAVIFLAGFETGAGPDTALDPVSVLVLVGALASVPALLVALYVIPAAVVNVAIAGRVSAGFAFGGIRPVLASGSYVIAWLLAAAVTIVSWSIVGALGGIAIIGFVLAAPVSFYATIVTAYLYAHGVTGESERQIENGANPDSRSVI